MVAFKKAKWIWQSAEARADEHVEFFTRFGYFGEERALLRISADSDYGVYVNGVLVAHGQYGDFPHYKVYDEIDVTAYLRQGGRLGRFGFALERSKDSCQNQQSLSIVQKKVDHATAWF